MAEDIGSGERRGFDDGLNFFWERKFIIDGEHRISKVAPLVPMSEDTLYAYVRGTRTMPTMLRVKVAELVHDKTLLDKAFDSSAFELQFRERGKSRKTQTLSEETFTLIGQMGRFAEAVKRDLADNKLSENEKTELQALLQALLNKMRTEMETLADTIGQ